MSTLKGFGTSKLPLYPKVNLGQGMPPGSWFWKYVGCGTLSDKNNNKYTCYGQIYKAFKNI